MTVAGELYLGLDFGTLSVRALVTDARGEVVAGGRPLRRRRDRAGHGRLARLAQPRPGWASRTPTTGWPARATPCAAPSRPAASTRTPSSAWASTSRVAPCCPRWPTARRSRAPTWRPAPRLAQALEAPRRPAAGRELTAVARERSEPWLDRYGGVVGLEWSFPKLLEVLDEDPRSPRPPRCGWRAATGWCGSSRRAVVGRRPDPGRPRAVHLPGRATRRCGRLRPAIPVPPTPAVRPASATLAEGSSAAAPGAPARRPASCRSGRRGARCVRRAGLGRRDRRPRACPAPA